MTLRLNFSLQQPSDKSVFWSAWGDVNVFVRVFSERGAQVLHDLRLQAQLWPPPLPGALSPWKLWTLLAVQWVSSSRAKSLKYHRFILSLIWSFSCILLGVKMPRVCHESHWVFRFWWADVSLRVHGAVSTHPLWNEATRVQKRVHEKTRVWPPRWDLAVAPYIRVIVVCVLPS